MKIAFAAVAASLILGACSAERTPPTAPVPGPTPPSSSDVPSPPASGGSAQPTEVPARFRGLYASDQRACAEDYSYNPAFLNVTVNARDVSFFETGGPVTNVNVSGDSIAITLRETVGDGQFDRAIYLALVDERTARYRPSASEPVKLYVRCPAQ